MTDNLFVYVTCRDNDEARSLAEKLLSEKLIACANIINDMESVYEWKGKVAAEKETVLILKSNKKAFLNLRETILAAHSYECPCIVALPVADGNSEFLSWIDSQVAPR